MTTSHAPDCRCMFGGPCDCALAEVTRLRAVIAEIRPLANLDGNDRDLTASEAMARIATLLRAVDEGSVELVPRQAVTDAVNEAERLRSDVTALRAALIGVHPPHGAICAPSDHARDAERSANATMIAAAPGLFAALEPFANVDSRWRCRSCNAPIAPEGYCGCEPDEARIAARLAITKARGAP